jgi:hypothetical protein
MSAANQDQQRTAVGTALIFGQVLSPSSASHSASGAQLAHALSASCLLTDWRPTAWFRHREFCHSLSRSAQMEATNQDQQRAAVRTALIFGQVLSPYHWWSSAAVNSSNE